MKEELLVLQPLNEWLILKVLLCRKVQHKSLFHSKQYATWKSALKSILKMTVKAVTKNKIQKSSAGKSIYWIGDTVPTGMSSWFNNYGLSNNIYK